MCLLPQDFTSSEANSVTGPVKSVSEGGNHLAQLRDILTLLNLLYSFTTQGKGAVSRAVLGTHSVECSLGRGRVGIRHSFC